MTGSFMYAIGWQTGSKRSTRWGTSLEASISPGRTTLLKMKTFESIATCCGGLSRLAACCKRSAGGLRRFRWSFRATKISGSYTSSIKTRGKSISWITLPGRSCQRSAAGLGFFSQANSLMPFRAAVDSKGNVYVAEDEGRRLQRFKVVGP